MQEREEFRTVPYAILPRNTEAGGAIRFVCKSSNGMSTLRIKGRVVGNEISGTVIWKNGTGRHFYEFSGKLE
jgi:hypothetical protein